MAENSAQLAVLHKAHADIRASYNYTDIEVECLWEIHTSGVPRTPETVRAEVELHRKLGTLDSPQERVSSDSVRNHHSTLKDFAHWLFRNESPVLVSNTPRAVRCLPYPNGCGRVFLLAMFPYWPTDARCGICIQRECHPHVGRARRDARLVKLHQLLKVGESKQIDSDLDRFVRFFGRFVELEGGIDGLAMGLHEWFRKNREDPRRSISATLGNAHLSMMKIWLELDKHRDKQADFDRMSDRQLEDFILQKMIGRLTKEQVQLITQEAEQTVGDYLDDGMADEVYADQKSIGE